MLTALSSHYWRPEFSPAQAASLLLDYCHDLADCRLEELEIAIAEYRRGPEKFFPKVGQLREIVYTNRKHRQELERLGRPARGGGRPMRWFDLPRVLWRPDWRESDVPADELVRDQVTGKWRKPTR